MHTTHAQEDIMHTQHTHRTRLTSAVITVATLAFTLVIGCFYPGDVTNIGEDPEVSNASGQRIAQQQNSNSGNGSSSEANGSGNGSGNEPGSSNGSNSSGSSNDTASSTTTTDISTMSDIASGAAPDIASASTPDNGVVTGISDVANGTTEVVNSATDTGNPADTKSNMPEIINNIPETILVDAGNTGTTTLADAINGNNKDGDTANSSNDTENPFIFIPFLDAGSNAVEDAIFTFIPIADTTETPLIAWLFDTVGQKDAAPEINGAPEVGNGIDAGNTGTTTLADATNGNGTDNSNDGGNVTDDTESPFIFIPIADAFNAVEDSFFIFIPTADAFSWTGGDKSDASKNETTTLTYDWSDLYDSWNPEGPGSGNPPDTFTGGGQQDKDGANSGSVNAGDTGTSSSSISDTSSDTSPTSDATSANDTAPTIGGPKTIVHELTLSDDPDYYWYNNITEKYQMKVHKSWALTEATDTKTVFGNTADNVNDKVISPATSEATVTFLPWDKKMSFTQWVDTFPKGYEVDYKGKKVTIIDEGGTECCLVEYANIPIKDYGMVQIKYSYISDVTPPDEESTASLPPQEEVNWSFFKKAHDALYEMVLTTQKYNGS